MTSIRSGPRAIVVALDDSTGALRALGYAVGLAEENKSTLVLVQVCRAAIATDPVGDAGFDLSARGFVRLGDLARTTAVEHGVRVALVRRRGIPALEIAAVANEVHADVVVVGGTPCRPHRVGGSVSGWLVRHGTWPVTVVP